MKFFKENNWARDALFFITLILLSRSIANRTIIEGNRVAKVLENSIVHEVDIAVLEQAQQLTHQIEAITKALKKTDPTAELEEKLQQLLVELDQLSAQYKKNSPALALLGPIGTAAIVIKEQGLERKLLETIDVVGSIIYALTREPQKKYAAPASIREGLAQNEEQIKTFVHQRKKVEIDL